MKIGAAEKCISTDLPIHLSGFGNPKRAFSGVHDDIFVKALAISGTENVIIVTADVLGFDKDKLSDAREVISSKTGVQKDHILFNASHTHSAPQASPKVNPGIGAYESEYGDFFYDAVVKTAVTAFEDLEDAVLSYSTENLTDGIGINRRRITNGVYEFAPFEEGVRNDEVTVLKATCKNRTKAILFQYACHPSTVGFDYISGDYPGVAMRETEKKHPGAVALFMQGCCGNIRVRTIRPDFSRFSGGTYDDIERFGKTLSDTVELAMSKNMITINDNVNVKNTYFDIDYQKLRPRDAYLEDSKTTKDSTEKIAAEYYYDNYDKLEPSVSYSVQRIDLGDDLTIFALEGEVCIEYDFSLKAMVPGKHVVTAGYSNGTPGYICTEDMYPYGGYEPARSCCCYYARDGFDPKTEQKILSEAAKLC